MLPTTYFTSAQDRSGKRSRVMHVPLDTRPKRQPRDEATHSTPSCAAEARRIQSHRRNMSSIQSGASNGLSGTGWRQIYITESRGKLQNYVYIDVCKKRCQDKPEGHTACGAQRSLKDPPETTLLPRPPMME